MNGQAFVLRRVAGADPAPPTFTVTSDSFADGQEWGNDQVSGIMGAN